MIEQSQDIAVATLYPDHYGFGQSTVYKALKDLGIERFEKEGEGKKAFITDADKEVLDEYFSRLANDGRQAADAYVRDRLGYSEAEPMPLARPRHSTAAAMDLSVPPAMLEMVSAIAAQMVQQPADVLAPQRQLKEAFEEGYVLSTGQVKQILGMKSWSGQQRYGFTFVKVGKVGSQSGWEVLPSEDIEAIAFSPSAPKTGKRAYLSGDF